MDSTNFKILIVDDHSINRQLLKAVLDEPGAGYEFMEAHSGELAIQMVERERPDIILLDILMPPGIDGHEVCRRLKAQELSKDIPIIIITTLDKDKDIVDLFLTGAADYITKPINGDELKLRVRTHLNMRRAAKAFRQNDEMYRAIAGLSVIVETLAKSTAGQPLVAEKIKALKEAIEALRQAL